MPPRSWPNHRLVENNPRLTIEALTLAGALHAGRISSWGCAWGLVRIEAREDAVVLGDQRIAIDYVEFLNGRYSRVRFLCPGCARGCRVLHHTRDRGWTCRTCSGLDYQSRHRNRWARGLGRLQYLHRRVEDGRRMRRWPKRRLRETMLAHEGEVADSFHRFVARLRNDEHGR